MSEDREKFRNKVVLITGGSKGLGFALAREFGKQEARVVFVARHGEEVEEAAARLRAEGLNAEGLVCDVSDEKESRSLLFYVTNRHGPIDVLVNNAGTIQVGPADTMTMNDFRSAMDTMLWGMIYLTLEILPAMRARGEGRIVNITSIGGKVSVPHLLPYSTAKFAAMGFSEGLQTEVPEPGVKIVTVVPGLIRTGSYVNALFHGETSREFKWFTLASSAPILTISAESAARRIVKATHRGEPEVILSLPANALARFKGVFPSTTQRLLRLSRHLLPDSTQEQATRAGEEVQRTIQSRTFERAITLSRRATRSLQPAHTRRE